MLTIWELNSLGSVKRQEMLNIYFCLFHYVFSFSPRVSLFLFGWLLIEWLIQWWAALASHSVFKLQSSFSCLFGLLLNASSHNPSVILWLFSFCPLQTGSVDGYLFVSLCVLRAAGCGPDQTAGVESRDLSGRVCWEALTDSRWMV